MPFLNRLGLPPAPSALAVETSAPDAALVASGLAPAAAPHGVAVGARGVAVSPLRPSGRARFGDEYLDVLTDGDFVDSGRAVRIVEIRGSLIVVEES
jgi:membrane-bound ClpP family serine protease